MFVAVPIGAYHRSRDSWLKITSSNYLNWLSAEVKKAQARERPLILECLSMLTAKGISYKISEDERELGVNVYLEKDNRVVKTYVRYELFIDDAYFLGVLTEAASKL